MWKAENCHPLEAEFSLGQMGNVSFQVLPLTSQYCSELGFSDSDHAARFWEISKRSSSSNPDDMIQPCILIVVWWSEVKGKNSHL